MNKQKKVLITITYNEMGIIIDTKAKEITQPEPKTGHWAFNPELYPEGDIHGHYECDQCGAWVREKANYCPDCGAHMIEEDEQEDDD